MKDIIILEGKNYISARRAAKIINYAQDYIGQLCRSGKLDCKMIGRSWFVTEESLLAHRESAVDSTEERVAKIAKNVASDINDQKIVTPVAPIISPVFVAPTSKINYETENKSFLPELNKKVPTAFTLPKIVATPRTAPRISSRPTAAIAFPNSFALTIAAIVLLVSGFIFTFSMIPASTTYLARNDASIITAVSGFFTHMMQSIGLMQKNSSPLAAREATSLPEQNSNWNGIGVVPATNTEKGDAEAKAKILSSFSDEVTVKPDKSGTAGVIKPVFKEGNGEDFLYVLVPVKEKKK